MIDNPHSPDRLIAPSAQAQLMHFSTLKEAGVWGLARTITELAEEYQTEGDWRVPASKFFAAVALYAEGCSSSTCRSYYGVASKNPQDVVDAYPTLSFHKHRAILGKSHGDLEEHRRLCDAWVATADSYGGNPGSVDALRAWLDGGEKPIKRWMRRLASLRRAAAALNEDEEAPEDLRRLAGRIVERTTPWSEEK